MEKDWYVYILHCGDGTYYTGVTTDPQRRLEQHQAGKGAKYTRGRAPLEMVYCEAVYGYGSALRREYAIKQMPRREKEQLILRKTFLAVH